MSNLKQLSNNVARAMRQSKFPVPQQARMTPLVASIQALIDSEVEDAVNAVMREVADSTEKAIKAIPQPDLSPVLRSVDSLRVSIESRGNGAGADSKSIADAVAIKLEGVFPKQEAVRLAEKSVEKRKPVSYHATIERNSRGQMVSVNLDPVTS